MYRQIIDIRKLVRPSMPFLHVYQCTGNHVHLVLHTAATVLTFCQKSFCNSLHSCCIRYPLSKSILYKPQVVQLQGDLPHFTAAGIIVACLHVHDISLHLAPSDRLL